MAVARNSLTPAALLKAEPSASGPWRATLAQRDVGTESLGTKKPRHEKAHGPLAAGAVRAQLLHGGCARRARPISGCFLQQKNWSPTEIGFVMTIGGLVGMVAVTPAGMLVDKVTAKRAVLVAAMVAVIAASLVILFLPHSWRRRRRSRSTPLRPR